MFEDSVAEYLLYQYFFLDVFSFVALSIGETRKRSTTINLKILTQHNHSQVADEVEDLACCTKNVDLGCVKT